jgi:hypothetical protein
MYVLFGQTPATIQKASDTSIVVTAPAGTGTVPVVVVSIGGFSGTSATYTYVSAPTVTGVSPASGPDSGGTSVTISGTGFAAGDTVAFGAAAATGVAVNSATSITATSPAGLGTVDVTVTGPNGTSQTSSADHFAYQAVPQIAGITPNQGPASGGNNVSIFGSGFTGATAVNFGSTSATFQVVSDNEIVATSPAGSGMVDITVVTPVGTSATSPVDRYSFIPVPSVSVVFPPSGPVSGYQLVFVVGRNFTGATQVSFGGALGLYRVLSSVVIVALRPPSPTGTATSVDVRVTGPGGMSAITSGDKYTYSSSVMGGFQF